MNLALSKSVTDRLVQALAVLLVGFQLYTASEGPFLPLTQRAVHVGLVLALSFLLLTVHRRKREGGGTPLYDVALAVLGLVAAAYVVSQTSQFNQFPGKVGVTEIVLGVVLLLLVLEAGRRSVGYAFIILAAATILYALFTDWFPGTWRARPMAFDSIIARLYATNVGLWGEIVGISASQLASLLIFADMLLAIGGMVVLRDLAIKLTGRTIGGAAKVANVASMFMGMISGSSAANAATTGAFTIPMMKSVGYPRHFAAAVEATSSTFGQLMPPVMGAAAFLIAEFVGVSYFAVTVAAYLPAFIIYASIFAAIHFYSRRYNLRGLQTDEIEKVHPQLQWYRLLPIGVPLAILVYELAIGMSADTASFRATAAAVGLYLLLTRVRNGSWSLREPLKEVYGGVQQAARSIVMIGSLVATAQVVVSMVNATSIGIKMSQLLAGLAGGNVLMSLILAMFVSMILGMGVPTTAAYVIAAATTASYLEGVGIDPLAAHLFIFYFAVISAITPPVCVAAYITSGIAGASWFQTAWHAMLISAAKYVLPFLFVLYPALRLDDGLPQIVMYGGATLGGAIFIEAVFWNYWRIRLNVLERVLLGVATVALYTLQPLYIAVGFACAAVAIVSHYWRFGKVRVEVEAMEASRMSGVVPNLG